MKVFINNEAINIVDFSEGFFAVKSCDKGIVNVKVDFEHEVESARIRPLRLGIAPRIDSSCVEFSIDLEDVLKISVEANGDIQSPMLLFIYSKDRALGTKPEMTDLSGKEFGRYELSDDETLYFSEGTQAFGWLYAEDKKNITVCGRGMVKMPLLDNYHGNRFMLFVGCENLEIRDITLYGAKTWNIVLIACKNVVIDGVNVISYASTGDGIDVCGSEDVTIINSFMRTADDCVALKAVSYDSERACKDVRNVKVTKCTCWNAKPGNALEIGYETRGDVFENIVFDDIDIIHCEREGWQSGGVFTIHNGDRALVTNVLYNDIRVEDAQEKLFDIKVLHSKYSRDDKRGDVRGIVFKDIQIVDGDLPPSIIRGYEDGEHYVEDIVFENITYKGEKLNNFMEAHMIVELTRNIVFK